MALPTASDGLPLRYPNKLIRLLLLGLEEVLGRSGLNAVLNLAQLRHLIEGYPANNLELQLTFVEVRAVLRALEVMYGPRAARGLALRAGRAVFRHGLKEFGESQNLTDLSFRLQPLNQRLKLAAEACAAVYSQHIGRDVKLSDENGQLIWTMSACPECWGRQSTEPACYLVVGVLQESACWASGGKNFQVEETTCVARGDPVCTFVLEKRPLD